MRDTPLDRRLFGRARAPAAPPGLWTPAALTSALKGWWDYSDTAHVTHSGSTLTSAADKSGNSRTMTAGGSLTWNSTGGPGGEGVADITGGYLEASVPSTTFANDIFLFSVWKKTGSATTYNSGPLTRTLAGVPAPLDANGQYRVVGDGTGYGVNGTFPNLGSDSLFTAWNVLTQYVVTPASDIEYFERINGTDIGSDLTLTNYADNASVLTAASRADRGTDANMRIGEQVACTGLITADIQKVEGYLAWKWGLQSILDAAHPYKSAAPTS